MIFVHNSWDLFNWHGILWYGRFLYKGSFGMVSFVMGAFGMVSFVLTPNYHMTKFPNLVQQFLSGLYFCLFHQYALFVVEFTYN